MISKKRQEVKLKNTTNYSRLFYLSILVLTTILAYAGVLSNGLLNWDDNKYLIENPYIKSLSWENIKGIFSSFVMGNYHPLTLLSYATEFHFVEMSPKLYHLTNLILHCFNAILVFYFIKRMAVSGWAGLLAALIFAVHPMHVESVAWIAERKDLLYTFFFLLSLIFYLRFIEEKKGRCYAMSLFFFLLSLLSKPAAIALAPLLFVIDYFKDRKINKDSLFDKVPYFILAVTFGMVALQSQETAMSENFAPHFSYVQRIFIVAHNYLWYLLKYLLPLNQAPFHPYPVQPGEALPWMFYVSPLIILLIAASVIFVKKYRKLLITGLLFFVICLAMVVQFIPVGRAMVAERYTYVPYIGLSLVISKLTVDFYNSRKNDFRRLKYVFAGILATAVMFLAIKTHRQVSTWKDSISLFSRIIERYPGDAWAHYNRGLTKYYSADYRGALQDYSTTLRLQPENTVAWFNRSLIYMRLEQYDSVIMDLDKALKIKPDYLDALKNRGNAKALREDYKASIDDFNMAIRLMPNDTGLLMNRGISYYYMKDLEHACSDWQKASSLGCVQGALLVKGNCGKK